MPGTTSDLPRILIARALPPGANDLISKASKEFNIRVIPGNTPPGESGIIEALEEFGPVQGLVVSLTEPVTKAVIDACGEDLKVVSTLSVGFNHIDVEACKEKKVKVGYTPNVLTNSCAEHTLGLMLSASRHLFKGERAVRNGEWGAWHPTWLCGQDLDENTVGIFGMGRIGEAVAQRAHAFGSKIIYCGGSRKPHVEKNLDAEYVDFDTLLARSDFLSVHCPLVPATSGLFGQEEFKKMKSTCVFINTSRGQVVKQNELIEALKNDDIACAALDVCDPEPLPTDSELLKLDNCIVIPHIASATTRTRDRMAIMTMKNALNAMRGEEMPAKAC